MSETMTADTIKQSVADNDVRFLRLSFNDINGKVKSVEVPKSQLDKVLTNQIRFDGSSINGYVNIQNSDLVLYPDFKTWTILPWADATGGCVGRLICSVHQTDGQPFEGDPRNNLERVLGHLKKFGLTEFDVGFEAEFHLFKLSEDGNWTTQVPDHASYFDIEAADKCASCRRDIVETLEKMGFVVEAAHHEVGDGQQEIDFRFDDALTTADRVQTFKMVVRQVARRHGFYATFMAKPLKGEAGNGMHTNMSLFKGKTNVFYDAQSATHLSKTALYFLNGILTHARAITALGNPTVNSYKRLIPGFEAPVYISWGVKNRTVLVRVPDAGVKTTRLELRSADPTANPYLLLAACLTAGLEGIKERQLPIKRTEDNLFTMSAAQRAQRNIKPLPSTLHNAIKSFQADSLMEEALGKHLTNSFIHVKKQEWFEYNQSVSDWERNHYMDY